MDTLPATEARMQAEIEALRAQHPETQDLYREVCVLLFFRYGLTPTANKLYQLVRKGSMSAPAEALARFWENLREKSRIRIEHPDLPQPLRDAAGEMVGTLWQRAQAAAQDTLAQLREEARAAAVAAEGSVQAAAARADIAEAALGAAKTELQATQERLAGVQGELAHAQGEAVGMQRQLDTGADQRRELQEALNAAQDRFTRELEQQRTAATAAEDRHTAEMKRVLLDVDRERNNAAKLQKEVDQVRRQMANQVETHRQELLERQQQMEALHQRHGELAGRAAELLAQRDQLNRDLDALRKRLESAVAPRAASARATPRKAAKPKTPARPAREIS